MINQILQLEKFGHIFVLVFVTSLLVTRLFWMILPTTFQINESGDYANFYEPLARNILEGHGFIRTDGTPETRYPPGYPLLLAGLLGFAQFFNISESTILSAFILLCMALESAFLFMLARTVWRPLPALITSLVWMTYPFALWLTKQPNSENSFMVVFYGGFCLFWHVLLHKNRAGLIYFLLGLVVGFAMLIRPIAIGVGFLMGGVLSLVGREMSGRFRLFLVTMVLLGNFTAILPWEAWIYSKTGRMVALSSGGVPSITDGLTFAVAGGFRRVGGLPEDVMRLMTDLSTRHDEMESLPQIVMVITEQLRTRPLTVVKLFAIKALLSWYGTERRQFETYTGLIQMPYLLLILWGSWVAWKNGGPPKQLTISIWLMVFYFWGISLLVVPLLRYMVPVIGLLFVLIPGCFLNSATRRGQTVAGG